MQVGPGCAAGGADEAEDPSVGALVGADARDVGGDYAAMRVAGAERLHHVPGLHGRLLGDRERLLHRDVDVLPFACDVTVIKGGQRASCGVDRRTRIALLPGQDVGRVLRVAGEPHDATHGNANDVGRLVFRVRPRLPEAGDRGEDYVRLDAGEPL